MKSEVKNFSVGLDIYRYLMEDGSLWRWTEERTYVLDYGSFKSSKPVKIVANGVIGCDAVVETLYVKDDQSTWYIGADPSKPSMSIGHGVHTAKIATSSGGGSAYLKESGELWAFDNMEFRLKHVQSQVQRVYTRGYFYNCFITNNGKLHFWVNGEPEILSVGLPGEIKHTNDIENHLFQIRGNQLVTRVPLDFEKKPAHAVLIRWTDSSGVEHQKTFEIQVKNKPEAPTRIGITPKASMKENAAKGTIVGQLYAVDSDQNELHSFQLNNTKEQDKELYASFHDPKQPLPKGAAPISEQINRLFAIQKDPLGKHFLIIRPSFVYHLFSKQFFDYEKSPYLPVHIRATDLKGLSVEQVVKIQLEDVNERPERSFHYMAWRKGEE